MIRATDPRMPLASTDHSLVRRFRRGEDDAATQIYLRYATRLEQLARREMSAKLAARFDPEDVVQSVFRTFFRRASTGTYQVPPGDELWQLLLVIATNKVRHLGRFHRQRKRDVSRTVATAAASGEEIDTGNSPDHAPLKILEFVVDEAMSDLPDFQRQMIQLRIQGYTAEEIAAKTQRCARTVERVLKRFRDKMTRHIEGPETC
ncbi:MAG: sigma-70 family RNA polymerase sigma factor [Planctomycetales bacterium]|nr:sigma-70 family RNA polymerase sigma factor [Planctomycetales bacterium]